MGLRVNIGLGSLRSRSYYVPPSTEQYFANGRDDFARVYAMKHHFRPFKKGRILSLVCTTALQKPPKNFLRTNSKVFY